MLGSPAREDDSEHGLHHLVLPIILLYYQGNGR